MSAFPAPDEEPEFHPTLISGGNADSPVTFGQQRITTDLDDPEPFTQIKVIPAPIGGSPIQLVISGQTRANAEQLASYVKTQKAVIKLAEDDLKRHRDMAESPTAHQSAVAGAITNIQHAELKLAREKNALAALEKLADDAAKAKPGIATALKEALAERDALASELNQRYGPIVDFVSDLFNRIRTCEDKILALKAQDATVDARSVEAIATGTQGKIYVKGQNSQSLAATLKLPAFGTSKAFNGVAPRAFNPATTPLELEIHNNSGNPVAVHGPFAQTIIPNRQKTDNDFYSWWTFRPVAERHFGEAV